MKRILTIVFALLVIAIPAFANDYGWTISNSQTDAHANTGGLVAGGPGTLYLWYFCSQGAGMSAADFGLQATGGGFFLSGSPSTMNGFLNAGSGANLLLAVGGCPAGPVVAAAISVFYLGGPGSLCIVASNTGNRVVVDCNGATTNLHAVGWDALAAPACTEALCTVVATEPTSWGQVKSLYR